MIKKIKGSLFGKVFLMTAVLLIICSGLTYGFIALLVPKSYQADFDVAMDQQVQQLIVELGKTNAVDSGVIFDRFLMDHNVWIALYDGRGQELSIPSQAESDILGPVGVEDAASAVEDGEDFTAVKNYSFEFADTKGGYRLEVTGSSAGVNQVIRSIGSVFPLMAVSILVISVLAALLYSRMVTRPVKEISSNSARMAAMDFDWHCDESRSDELGTLAQSLNTLSQKLTAALSELQQTNLSLKQDIEREKKLEQIRLEFFSAVSHELKTPITVIKGQLEGMLLEIGNYKDRDMYLKRSLEIANTLELMVQEILTVSRMESSDFTLQKERLDFSRLAVRRLDQFEDLIIQKDLRTEKDVQPEIYVEGDKKLLIKAVDNLIGNAVKYSPPKSHIRLSISREQGNLRFRLENTDVHIPEEALPKVFDAFYRVELSRSRQTGGSGLGLHIVSKILRQHRAGFQIENSRDGVLFTVTLPIYT